MSEAPPKGSLEATVGVVSGRLAIRYAFTNLDTAPVALWNKHTSPGPDGVGRVDPGAAYRDLEGSTLHVRKLILPIPEGLQVNARILPFLTRVGPGQSFEEVFTLPLPVKVRSPYRLAILQMDAPSGHHVTLSREAKASSVVFSLGVSLLRPEEEVTELAPGICSVWPSGPPAARQAILSETRSLGESIPVLDYSE